MGVKVRHPQLAVHRGLGIAFAVGLQVWSWVAPDAATADLMHLSWRAEGNQAEAGFGGSIGHAGDVNADGYSDIIVGAPGYDGMEDSEGRVSIYYGSASGLQTNAGELISGIHRYANLGLHVSGGGDVNGDGFADVLIDSRTTNSTRRRRAQLHYGSSTGLHSTAAWTLEYEKTGYQLLNRCHSAFAGDLNGDGFSDVVIGSPYFIIVDLSYRRGGVVHVHYGSSQGLAALPDWSKDGGRSNYLFGWDVASAGDVNGDGFDDLLISDRYLYSGSNYKGYVHAYYGSATGLASSASWTMDCDYRLGRFGESMSTAGDVNGDGYSDVIIGAPGRTDGTSDVKGRAYVYYGSVSGLSSSPGVILTNNNVRDEYFGASVSTAGDVDGDGYSDIVVGTTKGQGLAFVYIFRGSASGLSPSPSWVGDGDYTTGYFGSAVSDAGDVNGDGLADIVIGAPWNTNPHYHEGAALVYRGLPTGISISPAMNYVHDSAQTHRHQFFNNETAYLPFVIESDTNLDAVVWANIAPSTNHNTNAIIAYFDSGPTNITNGTNTVTLTWAINGIPPGYYDVIASVRSATNTDLVLDTTYPGYNDTNFSDDAWLSGPLTNIQVFGGVFFDDFKYETTDDLLGTNPWKPSDVPKMNWWAPPGGRSKVSVSSGSVGVLSLSQTHGVVGTTAGDNTAPRMRTMDRKFLSGTYAALIDFDENPALANDRVVQTFWAQNSYDDFAAYDEIYSECDFEYLSHNWWQWGSHTTTAPTLWMMTWENAVDEDGRDRHPYASLDVGSLGYVGLVFEVTAGTATKYAVYAPDGSPIHSYPDAAAVFAPESHMWIFLNMWIENGWTNQADYTMDVDWVYFNNEMDLPWQRIVDDVSDFRSLGWERVDTVPSHDSSGDDCDSDGASDSDEITAGTDPTESSSVFEVMGVGQPLGSGDIEIKWSSVDGKYYDIYHSLDLLSGFDLLTSGIPATAPENVYTDSLDGVDGKFYQIRLAE
jgi:hypothetical protein